MEADAELLAALRAGDEDAFIALVRRYQPSLLRVARSFVPSRSVAEEVVQDTWVGVIRGLDRFEGRSSVRTWLFRILVNRARSAAGHEHGGVELGAALDPARFGADGAWAEPVEPWPDHIEDRLDAVPLRAAIAACLHDLPPRQRQVVVLRDVEGLTGPEVCDVLGISGGTQRILLHRGRTRLRDALDGVVRRS